jgi:hypothetical protein
MNPYVNPLELGISVKLNALAPKVGNQTFPASRLEIFIGGKVNG